MTVIVRGIGAEHRRCNRATKGVGGVGCRWCCDCAAVQVGAGRSRSLGAECCAWFRDAGGQLFEWQELVIDGMLGVDENGRFTSTDDGLNVARQNGKGVVLQAIEGFRVRARLPGGDAYGA